ncbi:MAG: O-antigen ligase family protein [Lachnospiraceae bacterium]|nr:O-antigen ligase family protein [Lachnospiraceae bacterium]
MYFNKESKEKFLTRAVSEEGFFYFAFSLLILIPVCELITECFGYPFISQPYLIGAYGICGTLLSLLRVAKLSEGKQKLTLYPSDVFYILLIVFAFISLVCSTNFYYSLLGYDYDELIYHFLAYYSLMYAGTLIAAQKHRKKMLLAFGIAGILQCISGFAQSIGLELSYDYYTPKEYLEVRCAYGLTQNRNWYGGICVVFVALFSGLYLFYRSSKRQYLYLFLAGLAMYCSLCSKSRLSCVGDLCVVLFYMISFWIMRRQIDVRGCLRRLGILLFAFLAAIILAQLLDNALWFNISRALNERDKELIHMGSNRIYIWKYGLQSVPHHWLTGIGLDNYAQAFFENPSWHFPMFYQDKGHNEYIHILVTEGVFAAINYISMLIYSAHIGVKTVLHTDDEQERIITWILLGMFIGYAGQAFFNSSVINVAPYFWTIVGLTMPKKHQKPLTHAQA